MTKRKAVLSTNADSKTIKGTKLGYLTGILYLAPVNIADPNKNICPNAESAGCDKACLYSAGRGAFNNVQTARINKTLRFHNDKENFLLDLHWSIRGVVAKAAREGLQPTIRLNGTSDIDWAKERVSVNGGPLMNMFEHYPNITFYDYTKLPRKSDYSNYHLTFSYSSVKSYSKSVNKAKRLGMNMAVVFNDKHLPKKFLDMKVINGDDTDLRFLDETKQASIIGLYAKGKAKKDKSGFVIDVKNI